jgi:ribosomal protein S18 acetylase RimI-like enzyme
LGRLLANPDIYLVVAELSGHPVGFVLGYRLERLAGPAQLFVYEVDVRPAYRGQGVGTRLLAFVREVVQLERLREAFVFTSRDNLAAVGLYRATGAVAEEETGVCFVYPGTS